MFTRFFGVVQYLILDGRARRRIVKIDDLCGNSSSIRGAHPSQGVCSSHCRLEASDPKFKWVPAFIVTGAAEHRAGFQL